jgi:hypothetical protein
MEMENESKNFTTQQLKENHQLLLENNFLLHKIIEQNHLAFEILRENIRYYSSYWIWPENYKVKQQIQKLESLIKEINEYKSNNKLT